MKGTDTGTWATRQRMRTAERELDKQAEASYKRTVADWQAAAKKGGRECDTWARIKWALEGPSRAADHKPLTSARRYVIGSRPSKTLPQEPHLSKST